MHKPDRKTLADFKRTAELLFDGAPGEVGRFREGIIASIERALLTAYDAGRLAAYPEARRLALAAHRTILAGMEQALKARARTLEIEIEQLGTEPDSER